MLDSISYIQRYIYIVSMTYVLYVTRPLPFQEDFSINLIFEIPLWHLKQSVRF